MPLQVSEVTPTRRPSFIKLTPAQRNALEAPTPIVTAFPHHIFPQLRSIPRKSYVKTSLGLDPLPMNWQYTQRPDRAFANLNLGCYPVPKPPLPPFLAKKKMVVADVDEHMQICRMAPAKEYFEPLKEPEMISPPLRAACELVWESGVRIWGAIEPWIIFLWKLMWVVFQCAVETPARWLYDCWMNVEWWEIFAMGVAYQAVRWIPSPEVGVVREEAGKPLYILMIPYGGPNGGYTGPAL